ncbi:hypothetical protein [Azospirillum agricola]|uniref:hypothetical protein n=1 Tax=Azospirillum agricola TaxID=1720247 RepID=UPI000A0F02A9|nr:hypothetical protein [Azospirillum agricola]SMH60641.1 hypothetical protein SAMN02982994_5661 [Azospirillum lipoferum]
MRLIRRSDETDGTVMVSALVEVDRAANLSVLREDVERLGGRISHQFERPSLMTVAIPVKRLFELASLDEVSYIESDSPFR